ncbi:hypothetical protein D3C85_1251230 [compost metagenome]
MPLGQLQEAFRNEHIDQFSDLFLGQIAHDAVRRQTIEPIVHNLLRLGALQNRGNHRNPEALVHAADAGEDFLRLDRNVDGVAIVLAGTTVPAGVFNILLIKIM